MMPATLATLVNFLGEEAAQSRARLQNGLSASANSL